MPSLSQTLRASFGANPQKPFNQVLKERYNGKKNETLPASYVARLQKLINDNGGTPVGFYSGDLQKQALSTLGLPVTNSYQQNKKTLAGSL